MKVLKKSEWEKVLAIPVEFLSEELKKVVMKYRHVIVEYIKGKPIQYYDGGNWIRVYTPSFDLRWNYRVYQPTMDFHLTLEKDEADAIRRALSGLGLNSQERVVVTTVADKFQKQFDALFKPEDKTSETNQPCEVASL